MSFEPRCPTCRGAVAWDGNPHRPFCSHRCKIIDLGAWATESYRVPGDAIDPDADEDGGGGGQDSA
jgi:hypothetical protein